MEELEEFKDDLISDIVKKSVRTLPNENFESQMMREIRAEVNYKNEVSAQLKVSLRFFVGAILFGLALALAVLFGKVLGQYDVKTITILSLFIIGLTGILNVDNYRRLISIFS